MSRASKKSNNKTSPQGDNAGASLTGSESLEKDKMRSKKSSLAMSPTKSVVRCGSKPIESVWDWDVEGEDFVFFHRFPEPGWYVLRCDQGTEVEPIRFKVPPFEYEEDHPLQEMPAMEHFNNSACEGHDTTRTYTEEDIMATFARKGTSGSPLSSDADLEPVLMRLVSS